MGNPMELPRAATEGKPWRNEGHKSLVGQNGGAKPGTTEAGNPLWARRVRPAMKWEGANPGTMKTGKPLQARREEANPGTMKARKPGQATTPTPPHIDLWI